MRSDDPLDLYLKLAGDLFKQHLSETDVPRFVRALPTLDDSILEYLARTAESLAITQPRYGWAIAQMAFSAADIQAGDGLLRSRAAWYLARASSHWTQPKRAKAAALIARSGFEQLGEAGWVAACDWQFLALAWTQPNFGQAAQALNEALVVLEEHGFEEFIPHCRLSLSYAQILLGQHEAALANIRISEATYVLRADTLNQGRCWLYQASSLRRQEHFDEAFEKLQSALSVFMQQGSLTDQGRAHYQIAVGNMLQADHLPEAIDHFTKAAHLFTETDLELWRAMSINSLGAVYMINGELTKAEKHYDEARLMFAKHEVLGLLADNLNDSGKLNVLMGRPAQGVEQLKQAVDINETLGARLSGAVAMSNLGEAYGQLGRYQDALSYLERAVQQLEAEEAYFRMATCEKYMAAIWSRLGQPDRAHECLDRSAAHYEIADQHALFSSVHNYRAATFFKQGRATEALQSLERSHAISKEYGLRPQTALALRLLGDGFIHSPRHEEALPTLDAALRDFTDMGMSMEQAACLVSLGSYHASLSKTEQARNAFAQALQISEGFFPEIDWSAHIELGKLAEERPDAQFAIGHYHSGIDALKKIRNNFLQPALAGSYLSPVQVFDRVVSFAAKANAVEDTLDFIEASKASTLLRNLAGSSMDTNSAGSLELNDLRAQIGQLQNQLRVSPSEVHPLQSAVRLQRIRAELRRRIQEYDRLKSRLERQTLPAESVDAGTAFEIDRFRHDAASFLGNNWAALDYFLTKNEVIAILLTPDHIQLFGHRISERFETALVACDKARRRAEPLQHRDMEILGGSLLPTSLVEHLSPDTHLLIAPHRKLHQIPWAALQPEFTTQPLAALCIPSIVPSLQSLDMLWRRSASVQGSDRANGLLVGLSSFNGVHPDLPSVRAELTALSKMLEGHGKVLPEQDASWQNLLMLKRDGGFSDFAWLHIASHFSSDGHSGRLSRLVLSDREIFLDEIRDLAPLPGLVSLSACNSNDSFLFEGDERVDLQTTCLIAGANTVVGSSWPLIDDSAAELTVHFFEHYLAGASPSRVVVQAQRQMIESRKPLEAWASFVCAGMP